MTALAGDEFKRAIRQLRSAKDAAYRNAWKKRGEVIVAITIYRGAPPIPPYSDGPVGFEVLLDRPDMRPADADADNDMVPATQRILVAFGDLEECFQNTPAPIGQRAARAIALTDAATVLIGSLTREAPERYRDFLMTYSGGAG